MIGRVDEGIGGGNRKYQVEGRRERILGDPTGPGGVAVKS